jgi:hypothetical protein
MIDGIGSQPFSAQTLPPLERPHVSCREMVINTSRQQYAKDREAVETVVMELHEPSPVEAPVKKNNNNRRPGPGGQNAYSTNRPPQRSDRPAPTDRPDRSSGNGDRPDRPVRRPAEGGDDSRPQPTPKATEHKSLDELRSVLASLRDDTKSTREEKESKPNVIKEPSAAPADTPTTPPRREAGDSRPPRREASSDQRSRDTSGRSLVQKLPANQNLNPRRRIILNRH